MDDFAPIEQLCRDLLLQTGPSERARLMRTIARDIRKSQSDRIAAQQEPDGSPFAARKPKRAQPTGAYAVKFLYPKGAADPRVVYMKSWVRQGPLLTGFDREAGGIRSFFRDKIAKWLPLDASERNTGGGKSPPRKRLREQKMFRKLRAASSLHAGGSAGEAWVGFDGGAARVAAIHQEGQSDAPSLRQSKVRYPRRVLLGLTDAERQRVLDMIFEHLNRA